MTSLPRILLVLLLLLLRSTAAAETMQGALRAEVSGPQLRGASVGVLVIELPDGTSLFDHRSKQSFVPASNQKLFVAHAALSLLGAQGRFSTSLYRLGSIRDGALWGDLCLVGRGDPGLNTGTLYEMAAALRGAGIQRIAGDLAADDSLFFLPGAQYVGGAEAKVYYTPNGALSLNYNTAGFTVEGKAAGEKALVYADTPGSFVGVENHVLTRAGTAVSLSRRTLRESNLFHLRGSIEPGGRERFVRAITQPTPYCVETFRAILGELGIALDGQVRRASLPAAAVELHTQHSVSVAELVHDMNKTSNNFVADQLLLALGVWKLGGPATWAKAAQVLQEHVTSLGLSSTLVSDGSGLSSANRTSPADLVSLLRQSYRSEIWPELLISLPISGRDGSLKNRQGSRDLAGRVQAKTGTIRGVSTLSGYVFRDDGRVLGFSILINGHSSGLGAMHAVQDRMVRAMATLPSE